MLTEGQFPILLGFAIWQSNVSFLVSEPACFTFSNISVTFFVCHLLLLNVGVRLKHVWKCLTVQEAVLSISLTRCGGVVCATISYESSLLTCVCFRSEKMHLKCKRVDISRDFWQSFGCSSDAKGLRKTRGGGKDLRSQFRELDKHWANAKGGSRRSRI